MRITRQSLIRIAKETVQQRTHSERTILASYLTGSLLSEYPFLGGSTDIDLVFVHNDEPKVRREILPLSKEIHLDIQHKSHSEYAHPRELRFDPQLGSEIYDPLLLYDTRHFFEFVQAGVRDKYNEPVNVLARSRSNLDHARKIWADLQLSQETGPALLLAYLKALQHAADAVAVLNGAPLAERRLLLDFPARAETVGRPGLTAGLLGLLGAAQADAAALTGFLPAWQTDFIEAADRPKVDGNIAPARMEYYKLAFDALLTGENPQAATWPLIHTWTLATTILPESRQTAWQSACERLGLSGEAIREKVEGLDLYLDDIEELLEQLATMNGL